MFKIHHLVSSIETQNILHIETQNILHMSRAIMILTPSTMSYINFSVAMLKMYSDWLKSSHAT